MECDRFRVDVEGTDFSHAYGPSEAFNRTNQRKQQLTLDVDTYIDGLILECLYCFREKKKNLQYSEPALAKELACDM